MPRQQRSRKGGSGDTIRLAIIKSDRCKPKKCKQECKKSCPVARQGKLCIEVTKTSKNAKIAEGLCIGCGICVKKCPFNAITIINLPKNLESQTSHRFGPNSFKLHRLPTPRQGQVLGLVGKNGIGKSTALKILQGKIKPNLGEYDDPPEWQEILKYYRGNELQNYFTQVLEDDLKTLSKPQYVDQIPKKLTKRVGKVLKKKDDRKVLHEMQYILELDHLMDRKVPVLSGGELQRFAIAAIAIQQADVYMFDEPSSYLDVKQRIKAAKVIRSLCSVYVQEPDPEYEGPEVGEEEEEEEAAEPAEEGEEAEKKEETALQKKRKLHGMFSMPKAEKGMRLAMKEPYVLVVEHDLAILDYLSDFICVLYGHEGVYGIVTLPFSVREGINVFLSGHNPVENMRFRDVELNFKVGNVERDLRGDQTETTNCHKWPKLKKTLGEFKLKVAPGSSYDSEICIMLGENGTGKTTFIKMMAGLLPPDDGKKVPKAMVSYKPQKISPSFPGTVRQLLHKRIPRSYMNPSFQSDVMKPMKVNVLFDRLVTTLSGGELQRTALAIALGTPADLYLIDEPSAYLDSEQRIHASKVIKRFILHAKKRAFVVEHDFIMATYLADRIIVFEGEPGVKCHALEPMALLQGMNRFLHNLEITFRQDPTNFRPRINKTDSIKDQEQKASGQYFFYDPDEHR